jgi:hypothetical protein
MPLPTPSPPTDESELLALLVDSDTEPWGADETDYELAALLNS